MDFYCDTFEAKKIEPFKSNAAAVNTILQDAEAYTDEDRTNYAGGLKSQFFNADAYNKMFQSRGDAIFKFIKSKFEEGVQTVPYLVYFCVDRFSAPAILDFLASSTGAPIPRFIIQSLDLLNIFTFLLQVLGLSYKVDSLILLG